MGQVEASLVDQGVFDLLVSVCTWPVGWSSAPTPADAERQNADPLANGYAVMNRIVAPAGAISRGFSDQPDSMRVLRYQFTGVGVQMDQSQLISEQTASVITARAGGAYQHDLIVPGHKIMRRWFVSEGPPDPGGPQILTVQAVTWVNVMVHAT